METVNGCLGDRLDEMEAAIRKTSFRKGTGRANEVNYWVSTIHRKKSWKFVLESSI